MSPNVAMNRMMSGWLTSGRSISRSTRRTPSTNITTTVSASARGREIAGQRPLRSSVEADQRERGEHHHDALREIEHARGLEDQHEAERDQRIEHAGDEPFPQRLHQQVGRRAHLHEGIDEDLVEEVHPSPGCSAARRALNAPRRDRRRSPRWSRLHLVGRAVGDLAAVVEHDAPGRRGPSPRPCRARSARWWCRR